MDEKYFPAYILNSRAEANTAIDALGKSGVDVRKLSIVGSLSALGAALVRAGISRDQAVELETALNAKKYLLMMRGSAEDFAKVNCVLASSTNLENS
jgi:hypothetical protein